MVNIEPKKEATIATYAVLLEIEGEAIREFNVLAATPEKAETLLRRRLHITARRA